MTYKRIEQKVFVEYLYCDACNEKMIWDGIMLASSPPQYNHACKNNHVSREREVFPRTVYIPVETLECGE